MSRILVVDDDAQIRELAGIFLRKEGFEIVEASDGVAALAKLAAFKVDLAVLDIMMPNMDGWELCRQLKEPDRNPNRFTGYDPLPNFTKGRVDY